MKCAVLLALATLGIAGTTGLAGVSFDSSGFSRRGTIRVTGYDQTEVLTNFPVLISLCTNLPGFDYSQLSANAEDLRFAAGGTNELNYDIDTWNTNGVSYVWVQVPELSAGTAIRIYWCNAAATKPAYVTNGTTWRSGYVGVWHMNQPNTINAANGTAGTGHSNATTNGTIGNAQFFALPPNNNNYISVGDLRITNYTISAWTRNTYQSNDKTVFYKQNSFLWEQWNIDYNLNHQVYGPSGDQYFQAGGNADLNEPNWSYEVVAYDAATGGGFAYMNSNQANGYPQTKSPMIPNANANSCSIGANMSTHSYYGSIDEVRLSAVVRSPNWEWACYQNQKAPDTFVTYESDPSLAWSVQAGTNLVLSWPGADPVLQVSSALGVGAAWITNGLPVPMFSNGMSYATLPISGTASFYRLALLPKDFTLAVSPASITVAQGMFGVCTVAVNRIIGFPSVTLAASNLPGGVTALFVPAATTNTSSLVLDASEAAVVGTSTVVISGIGDGITRTTSLTLAVTATTPGGAYTWPPYSPNLDYDFRDEYSALAAPTSVLQDCSGVVGTVTSGWWCFRYGSNMNSLVTSAAWTPMLQRFNTDFAYFRNIMGWPPDKRIKHGYFSSIYLFGSALGTDNASNTVLGGWMGSINYNGEDWPMVLLSYYPVYSFDPACPYGDKVGQQGACIHEGIHSLLADMPGCKNAGWFHEGGNTWLQSTMAANQSSNYSGMGWLSAGATITPFMPIECYSGWLQDDSFGGPSAEGVNRYSNSVQLCTWRNLLGGTQYGESFPHFMGEIVSDGSIAWIWKNCTSRVLEGLATAEGGLGDAQTRRLIKEFRGRQVMCDFGKWTPAYIALLNNNWGLNIHAEYPPVWINCAVWTSTCYVVTSNSGGTLTPEWRTLPGWSGANQIPLTVSGSGTVKVYFQPIGTNMSCQLVYRATDNSVVYSRPVSSGTCSLTLTKAVKSNVVVAVICNTDYVYKGESTRTNKFDYRLTLGTNVTGTASVKTKWYN